jgi:hypothetical protein
LIFKQAYALNTSIITPHHWLLTTPTKTIICHFSIIQR